MTELITRRKLFEQVAEHLERRILNGDLKPGDRLPTERDLQSQFGVGRPAIREALITLQRSGLIQIGNGAPARVAMPSPANVLAGLVPTVKQMLSTKESQRHFQHVRRLFECGIARAAADNPKPEFVAALRQALDRNGAAIGDYEAFAATDVAFHSMLATALDNPVIAALYDALAEWLKYQRHVALKQPGLDKISHDEHTRVFEAIAAGDRDAAEKAMHDHLVRGEQAYWREARMEEEAAE